jgi:hypothetical protein
MKKLRYGRFSGLLFLLFLMTCKKEEAVQVPQGQIVSITFQSDTTGLKADGLSTIRLLAHIPANTVDGARNVTFSASAALGTFQGSQGPGTNVVPADADGNATTAILVGKVPGVYYISAQIKNGDQIYKTDDVAITLHSLAVTDKLSLSASNLQPIADALSTVTISVSAKYVTEKSINLTTNYGAFGLAGTAKTATVSLDDKGNGTALFQMDNQLLPHVINGTFSDGTGVSLTLNPVISRPDTLIAEAGSQRFDTVGTALAINAYMRKYALNAKPTQGIQAGFVAYQLISGVKKTVGRFTGISLAVSDPNGNVPPVSFYGDTGDINTKQDVIIEVSAPKTATTNIIVQLHLKLH